jgi:hypothetical protein
MVPLSRLTPILGMEREGRERGGERRKDSGLGGYGRGKKTEGEGEKRGKEEEMDVLAASIKGYPILPGRGKVEGRGRRKDG